MASMSFRFFSGVQEDVGGFSIICLPFLLRSISVAPTPSVTEVYPAMPRNYEFIVLRMGITFSPPTSASMVFAQCCII